MATYNLSEKELVLYFGLTFLGGMIIGSQITKWRLKYLKAKRDYLQRKMVETQKKLNQAAS